jgi:hypothetical protein
MGCGVGCLIILILIAIGGGLGYWGVKKILTMAEDWTVSFEEQGYTRVEGMVVQVPEEVDGDRVYKGQTVILEGNHNGSVAIICQIAEVKGTITGSLDFKGQMLMLYPSSIISKDLRVEAQLVQRQEGSKVLGEITGEYQLLDAEEFGEAPIEVPAEGPTEAPLNN